VLWILQSLQMDGPLIIRTLNIQKYSYIIHFLEPFLSAVAFYGFFLSSGVGSFFASFFYFKPKISSVNLRIFSYYPENTHMEFDKGLIN